MADPSLEKIKVNIEVGKKKTFAAAQAWPGWCRSGSDEESSLQNLLEHGGRYARVLHAAGIEFQAPVNGLAFEIIRRLEGGAGTDFGVPSASLSPDSKPLSPAELERLIAILLACWAGFAKTVKESASRELSKGPRGGGRDREKLVRHVLDAESSYLARIGWKFKSQDGDTPEDEIRRIMNTIPEVLGRATRGELPTHGPRGGAYWVPRFYIHYAAWHVLDHTWEIENRVI